MIRSIINPYAKGQAKNEYNCFGCAPNNAQGLHLHFNDCGDYIEAHWHPEKQFEGFHNVLHGGIQATLLDEVAAWVVFTKCKTAGVTQRMKIEYPAAVYLSTGVLKLTGRLKEQQDKSAVIEAELINAEGKLCAQAEVVYYLFPEAIARRKFNYPGVEAFYK